MPRCRQVNRYEIWIWIPVCVEIDRRLYAGPCCLGYRRISMQQIIESQTRPPCDCAPTLDAYEASNLVMDLVACAKSADVERNGQAGGQSIESQTPPRNISRIGSSAVVVVLDRGNLRFCVGRHPTMHRVECLCHVIVDTQCFVQQPFLPWSVDIASHAQAAECGLRQQESSACCRRDRAGIK